MYPEKAADAGVRGRVLIEATIARNGRVSDARVIDSEPPGVFDDVALAAFRKWRYCPLQQGDPDYPNPVKVALVFAPPS